MQFATPRARARGRKWRPLIGLLAAVVAGSTVGTALAYPRGGLGNYDCGGTTVNFRFVDSDAGNWTSARKDAVRGGFAQWETVTNSTGSKRAVMREVTSPQSSGINVTVRFAHLGDTYGDATCSQIRFGAKYKDNTGILKATAAHEMGHTLVLAHAHRNDSANGAIPTMATCLSTSEQPQKGSIEPDDHAALMQKKGTLNTFHANESFEAGNRFWNKTDLTYWEIVTSPTPPYGSRSLKFRRSSGGEAADRGLVKQNVRLQRVGQFHGVSYIRKQSGSTGRVVLSMPWRPVAFKLQEETCPKVQITNTGDWMAGPSVSVSPTTSFASYSTSTVNPQCGTQIGCNGGSMGAEVTIRVRNALTDGTSTPPPAFVDALRAKGV